MKRVLEVRDTLSGVFREFKAARQNNETQIISVFGEVPAFLQLESEPCSCSSRKKCRTCFIRCKSDFRKMNMSSIYAEEGCHRVEGNIISIAR